MRNRRTVHTMALIGAIIATAFFRMAVGAELPYKIPETPEGAQPPDLVVRERTVYVPYEKLKAMFEKEYRGVFLPYREFLKLWKKGQVTPPEDNPKPPVGAVITGGDYIGEATDTSVRFHVSYNVRALGEKWTEILLPLRNAAVETVNLSDTRAVFAPKNDGYAVLLPQPGECSVNLVFSVAVESKPGRRKFSFGLPRTAVSRLELLIPEPDVVVELEPKTIPFTTTPEGGSTRLLAFLGDASRITVTWKPPEGVEEKGEAIVVASQAMHAHLAERVFRLSTEINYKIERNEAEEFRVRMPEKMRLMSVRGDNIREWRPEGDVLLVRLHSPIDDKYKLSLRFERILEKAPESLSVPFPVAVGTLREDGYLAVTADAELRTRVTDSKGLSQVDPVELPGSLRLAGLLAGFRYLGHPIALSLAVEKVQPQIRSRTTAILSLGTEQFSWQGWVDYEVEKVGVFQFRLGIADGWEVEKVGDEATVEDFEIKREAGRPVLVVNMKNRVLGKFRLPFTLSRQAAPEPGKLTVSPPAALDSRRDKGIFAVTAPKTFKLTTAERKLAVPANDQLLMGTALVQALPPEQSLPPLTYSYSKAGASVVLDIEKRLTEIRVTAYHSITVKDGGISLEHTLGYYIEYAGTDTLRFSLPTVLDDKCSVRCAQMKEKKKIGEENGRSRWEIRLQEKLLGNVTVKIRHDADLEGLEPEQPVDFSLPSVRAEDVKSQEGFVAVCKQATLEIRPEPVNLEPVEATNLPAEMRAENVYLAYRYFRPDNSLTLKLTRHNVVELTTTVIDYMNVVCVLSEEKKTTVRMVAFVENPFGEQYLEVSLPAGAKLRTARVNNVTVSPNKLEDGGLLVKLVPEGPFPLELIYSVPAPEGVEDMGLYGSTEIITPKIVATRPEKRSVPVNRIDMDLYVPDDYAYTGFSGTLHPRGKAPSNALRAIARFFAGDSASPPVAEASMNFHVPKPTFGTFTTQGKLYRFHTLSQTGTVAFRYCNRKLFSFINLLVFLAVLVGGWLAFAKWGCSRVRTAAACILVPTALGWLTRYDAGELFSAAAAGGWILAFLFVFAAIRRRYKSWKKAGASLAFAPDPFLEDAGAPPPEPEPEPDIVDIDADKEGEEEAGEPDKQPPEEIENAGEDKDSEDAGEKTGDKNTPGEDEKESAEGGEDTGENEDAHQGEQS